MEVASSGLHSNTLRCLVLELSVQAMLISIKQTKWLHNNKLTVRCALVFNVVYGVSDNVDNVPSWIWTLDSHH